MKISLNWIKRLIPDLKIKSYDDFFNRLIEIGFDIESIENKSDKYKNFVIGEVKEAAKHPNADKLTVCKVDVGNEILNIVCGAQNVAVGQKVCVAKTGAIIPKGGFEIKKSKLRGELSEGMICAEDEIGVSENHSGIMVLDENAVTGSDFASYIGYDDYIIEIGVTPNRGDLFSQIGMAREIAGAFGLKVKIPEVNFTENDERTEDNIKIRIEDTELCKRFTGRILKNVTMGESPEWLKSAVESVGLRSINNIVDVTNYLMMETGQPLHTFDYDKIKGKEIIVKCAEEGEKFKTLDSKERILNSGSLMVCDAERPSGIAGIMGGENSEISGSTKNVFIEAAYFEPVCIRKSSKKLQLQTDASQRFERGVDIDNIPYVSDRAAMLIQVTAGGEILKGMIDIYPSPLKKHEVGIRTRRCSQIAGIDFTDEKIKELLESIEILYLKTEDGKQIFSIPQFRREDLQREIDLIEEVIRLYGYSNLENDYRFTINASEHIDYNREFLDFIDETKNYLTGRGFNEIISYSQQDDKKIIGFNKKPVMIKNPNSVVMNAMRVNLTYGMLSTVVYNYNNLGKNISLKLFETGKIFNRNEKSFSENYSICLCLSGEADIESFDRQEIDFDYFDIKGELQMYLSKFNIENYEIIYYYEDNIFYEIEKDGKILGKIYVFDKKDMQNETGTENDVYIAEMDANIIFGMSKKKKEFTEIAKYPVVKRDIAILADEGVKFNEIINVIKESGGKLLSKARLFDIYKGDRIGTGKKSMAFSLEFMSNEKTLTDEEISKQLKKVIKNLESKAGVTLRDI